MKDKVNVTLQTDLDRVAQEDPELDQLIAIFPKETASFLTQIRKTKTHKDDGPKSGQVEPRNTPKCTSALKCRVILPQTTSGDATFYAQTTYKNFFGTDPSKRAEPSVRFGEIPVFTDSILYPGQQRRLQSTTHETFVSKPVRKFK